LIRIDECPDSNSVNDAQPEWLRAFRCHAPRRRGTQ